MGQNVIGVLYGVVVTTRQFDKLAEDGHGRSLVEQWNGQTRSRSSQIETVDNSNVVGIWVVCSHGDDKGVPDVEEPVSLTALQKGANFKRAKKAWDEFARWVKTQGVPLGKPQLFIAPTEVA